MYSELTFFSQKSDKDFRGPDSFLSFHMLLTLKVHLLSRSWMVVYIWFLAFRTGIVLHRGEEGNNKLGGEQKRLVKKSWNFHMDITEIAFICNLIGYLIQSWCPFVTKWTERGHYVPIMSSESRNKNSFTTTFYILDSLSSNSLFFAPLICSCSNCVSVIKRNNARFALPCWWESLDRRGD